MSIERLMQPGLWQLAQLTVAIAGASLVTRLFCRRRPHLAYVLWLLVLVKSLMPPIWSSHLGLFSWAAAQPKIAPLMLYRDDVIVPATTPLTIHPSVVVSGHDWARLLIIAWIGGGAALLLMTVVRSWRLRRRIEQSSVAPSIALQELARSVGQKLGLHRGVSLRVCDDPVGPAVLGVFRPILLMPRQVVEGSTAAKLRTIVAHEIVHLRRRDPLVAGAQLLSQAIWWFNPLVWWMNRQMNQTREICCDAEVVSALPCPPAEYAQTLIDVLRQRRARWLTPAMGIYPVTQTRIEHIMKNTAKLNQRTPWRYWALAALCAVVVLPGAGMNSGQQARGDEPPTADAVGSIAEVTHFVRIIVDGDTIRFQGQPVSADQLPSVLAQVPDRPHTIVEIGYTADDVTMGQYMKAFSCVANDKARRELGFREISEVGRQPADSRGSDDRRVFAALTPAPESELTHEVPFSIGHTEFNSAGDSITITDVRGDRDQFEIGGTYEVHGTYHLVSTDKVTLAFWISARVRGEGWGDSAPGQFATIAKGDGTFTLIDRIPVAGYPHINLNIDHGSIGTMYFGSGDWLNK